MNSIKIMIIKKLCIGFVLIAFFGKAERILAQNFRVPRSNMDTRSNFNNGSVDNSAGMHKIETIKSDFLSDNMHLSNDEANKFWPVYNQYQQEMNVVLHQKRQNMVNSKNNAQDIVKNNFEYDSKILTIKKHFNDEFSRILPPEKVMNFWKSERQFNEEMIKRLKNRHEDD
ncbi:MAG: hypothetical protein EOP42_12820 [Sphingobacteriaceae bacterium]|nr:MAG: hypothetical protein EOP42_12820 [Sphingobacteriaceae bacterium]